MDSEALDGSKIADRVTELIVTAVEEEVERLPDLHPELAHALEHLLTILRGGKRLRARFTYEAWLACGGGDMERVLIAAASVELSHAFALVQDDVIDRSAMRRGKDSVHRRASNRHRRAMWRGDGEHFGHSLALILANYCWGWSHRLLDRASPDPQTVTELKRVAEHMLLDGTYGETLELVLQHERRFEVEQCRQAAHYKTGMTIFKPPLLMDALLAGADRQTLKALAAFGEIVGDAYQMRDDLLGTFGDPLMTGKPDDDDLRDGKPTVLIATALLAASDKQRTRLMELYAAEGLETAGVQEIRELIRTTGAVDTVNNSIDELTNQASRSLTAAPLTPSARRRLESLAREALHRTT